MLLGWYQKLAVSSKLNKTSNKKLHSIGLQDLIRPTSVTIGIRVTQTVTTIRGICVFTSTLIYYHGIIAIGDPVIFAIPFIVLGVLIVLSVCWMILRICWRRQCCCPRVWRSDFWLIFFCFDCCTYDDEGNN